MKQDCFKISIAAGLGDTIYLRTQLDQLIPKYNEIKVSFCKEIIRTHYGTNVEEYYSFIKEFGKLFFSDPPYTLTDE